MKLIEINSLNKEFGKEAAKVTALNDINATINKGEMVAIIGVSGSGKSTLLNIIGSLDIPSSGECIINSRDITKLSNREKAKFRNEELGFIVQSFALINDYTVKENIEIPLEYAKIKRSKRNELIKNILDSLGMSDKINKKPSELSGGQCQRVAIARAIVNNPEIILADEPTGALDSKTGQQVMDLLKELNRKGTTIIIVTHDIKIANQCSRILTMADGKLIIS